MSKASEAVMRFHAKRLILARQIKLEHGCMDCPPGITWPAIVLDFDHVRGKKEFGITTKKARSASLERFMAEIAKCDVVCANHHRIRTSERG